MLIWEDLHTPTVISELSVQPQRAHVFMFSAITWNRHQIHYSDEAARAEGHDGVVVQRALLGNYLAKMLTDWAGGNGELRHIEWKVIRSALPGRTLHCAGRVTRTQRTDEGMQAECEIRITDDEDAEIAVGTATLAQAPEI